MSSYMSAQTKSYWVKTFNVCFLEIIYNIADQISRNISNWLCIGCGDVIERRCVGEAPPIHRYYIIITYENIDVECVMIKSFNDNMFNCLYPYICLTLFCNFTFLKISVFHSNNPIRSSGISIAVY